ncbi:hypothetical protein J4Q44_G00071680 [Coregonus suidteri]|uniref:Uncharacterized protein n=1 Tax=Coregonus suidteri TaxID=861788 RepID=A0AAN8MBI3_9TELE
MGYKTIAKQLVEWGTLPASGVDKPKQVPPLRSGERKGTTERTAPRLLDRQTSKTSTVTECANITVVLKSR